MVGWKVGLSAVAAVVVGVVTTLVALLLIGGNEEDPVAGDLPEHFELRVLLSESLLTALIRQAVSRTDPPIAFEDLRVETRDRRMLIRGDARLLGGQAESRFEFDSRLEGNMLSLRVLDAHLGGLPLPDNLTGYAEQAINERLGAALEGLPATLTGVRVNRQGLSVTATVDPTRLTGTADRTPLAGDQHRQHLQLRGSATGRDADAGPVARPVWPTARVANRFSPAPAEGTVPADCAEHAAGATSG